MTDSGHYPSTRTGIAAARPNIGGTYLAGRAT